jgi:hypothetical protein
VHRYKQSCEVERLWAPRLDEWLRTGYVVREATTAEQWRGIDRVAADGDGEHTIDYKCDLAWARTRNCFIEHTSNAQTGRPGWALTSEADWLLYFLIPDRVLVLTFVMLRRHLLRWQQVYPTRRAKNEEGYDTLGLCVPVSIVEHVAEYTARLDQGDAAILEIRDDRR